MLFCFVPLRIVFVLLSMLKQALRFGSPAQRHCISGESHFHTRGGNQVAPSQRKLIALSTETNLVANTSIVSHPIVGGPRRHCRWPSPHLHLALALALAVCSRKVSPDCARPCAPPSTLQMDSPRAPRLLKAGGVPDTDRIPVPGRRCTA